MNSEATTQPITLAYLAQNRIRLKRGTEVPRTIDSVYGNSIREKAVRAQQKHSWKASGSDGSPFGAMLWGKPATTGDIPIAITSICGGRDPGALLYSLQSGSLCALLEVGELGLEEHRVWNDNRTQIRHVSMSSESGDMVFSVLHENGTATIGVKMAGEGGLKELTEGDSFDTAPRWRRGGGRRILFQSAGIGRNREGHFLALGPFSIQQLDMDTAEMTTIVESAKFDHLAPQSKADGSLLYIRRPYSRGVNIHPLRVLKDVVLFPIRLLGAVFGFLNFFSSAFTGKQLTSGAGKKHELDMRQMMIWGDLVRAQRPGATPEESADLVPKSWELCCRNSAGETKVLAGGVLAYDVRDDGEILFTNGNAIYLLHPDGRKAHLLTEAMIEQVFFVPSQ